MLILKLKRYFQTLLSEYHRVLKIFRDPSECHCCEVWPVRLDWLTAFSHLYDNFWKTLSIEATSPLTTELFHHHELGYATVRVTQGSLLPALRPPKHTEHHYLRLKVFPQTPMSEPKEIPLPVVGISGSIHSGLCLISGALEVLWHRAHRDW